MTEDQESISRILDELEGGGELSQRALAARLGIALGRVNQLLRILSEKQWVRGGRGPGHRVHYVVTPEGASARARMSREQLGRALVSFGAVRDRVRDRLGACGGGTGASKPPVVLYGTGAIAQIAFACAAELGVPLVGFVADDSPGESYLGLPLFAPRHLTSMTLNGRAFEWLIVATLTDQDAVRARLVDLGFPLERVRWL